MTISPPDRRVYVGVGFVAMSLLMLELILTRLFSVTLWYHFAFMAVSIALFGTGAGGVYVYLMAPGRHPDTILRRLATSALATAGTSVVALLVLLNTRFVPNTSPGSLLLLARVYLVVAIPFFFGGFCISLVLAHFSRHVSSLYFADLIGAGTGCVLVIPTLYVVTGPSAVIAASALAAVGAWWFAAAASWRPMKVAAVVLCALLGGLVIFNSATNILKVDFVKGNQEVGIVLERWNPFSRVVVQELPERAVYLGWAPSTSTYGPATHAKLIHIDGHAATPMFEFDGNLASIQELQYDAPALAYHVKKDGQALVIGPGGGKDVLAALSLGAKRVVGVEINPSVVGVVKDVFGDYSGHLYERPDVTIVVDEARSYIARSTEHFDVIQASLVDSWAATAAGAFVLTENHLYTIEAFHEYYDHLTDDGILTMSRFFPADGAQTLRLVALGYEAWKARGVKDPEKHIFVIRNRDLGTVLFKKSEFTTDELSTLEGICQRLRFQIVATPKGSIHPVIQGLFDTDGSDAFYDGLPFDLRAPVDDRPFFFHMVRPENVLRPRVSSVGYVFNDDAMFVLGGLLIIVTILSLLFIMGPLWTFRRASLRGVRGKAGLLLYFCCLGVGFMMVEVPLMQKLLLFLGHPIYALSVTLFGLLIFSGIGSYLTNFIPEEARNQWLFRILLALCGSLALFIAVMPSLTHALIALPTSLKIPLVLATMLPLGCLMGMPMPLGIKLVDDRAHEIIPWAWGINGATSVFGSVFAIAVAITMGFSTAMIFGLLAYVTASLIVHRLAKGAGAPR